MSESNIQGSPGSVFICYRREDSADVTGRIYDRLVDHFGPERVFMDVEAIRLGYDFRSEIDETIKVFSIVIVVIGDKWLAEVDGKRRIDDENDRVRIEIEAALRREIPIIPILAREASHPTKVMLPASLEALAYRHGTSIRHEHFRGDVDFLISQMDKLLARRESTPSKPVESKEPQETEADATSITAPVSLGETAPQFPTRAAPPELDSGTERRRQDSVASAKDPMMPPAKSTHTTLARQESTPSKPAQSKKPQETEADATSVTAPISLGETAPQFPTRAAPPERDSRTERRQQDSVASAKDPTTPVKSTDTTQSEPAIPPIASIRAITALEEPAVWTRKRLIIVAAVGITVVLLLGITGQLTRPHPQDASAQYRLGVQYANGEGVTKDLNKAAELFQKAADQGYALAQYRLGLCYQLGNGVPEDLGKAAELYQKAADQGSANAQYNLGVLYDNGQGVTKDLGKAVELFQKAADHGYAPAQRDLGRLYENGEGVTKDLGKAAELYQKAAELYQKAADQGFADAQYYLGSLYENGEGVTKDLAKAAELFQKAADQGHAYAQVQLGWLYETGVGVPKDLGKAKQLYQKAADQGNPEAIASLKSLSGN